MMVYLKQIFLNLIVIALAILIGHYSPLFYLFVGSFLMPLILVYINLIKSSKSLTVGAILILSSLLLSDYLFRIYGGGTHDDVGKTLTDLAIAISVLISILFIFYYKYKRAKKDKNRMVLLLSLLIESIFYLVISIGGYLLFNNF